jgi:hypothetical protein
MDLSPIGHSPRGFEPRRMQCFYTVDFSVRVVEEYARVAGVMVSIVAFQAVDPGSIPGLRKQRHRVTPSCSFGCTGTGGRECPPFYSVIG